MSYLSEHLEPYFNLAYANDIGRDNGTPAGGLPGSVGSTQADDDDEFQLYFGFRYFGNNFSGALEYGQVVSRNTMDSHNIMLTFRYDL